MTATAKEIEPHSLGSLMVDAQERAKTDPVWFAKHILQLKQLPGEKPLAEDPMNSWELDSWTEEMLEAAADVVRVNEGLPTKVNHNGLNQITVRAMHGPGKTFGMALLMHWFGFCFHAKIPMTAPKIDQLKRRLWPEFRKILNRAVPGYKSLLDVQAQTIFWRGDDGKFNPDHWAFMETAASPENLAGLHNKHMLIGVDEATGVSEDLWPVIESAISTGLIVILVIISNPSKMSGTFAASHLRPIVSKHWYKLHIRLDQTHRVPSSWVQKMCDKYGKDSPVVKIRCYGEFAAEDENQLIAMSWIEAARNREFVHDGSIPRQRISIDAADGGENFTVLTHAAHYQSFMHLTTQRQFSFPGGQAVVMCADEAEKLWRKHGMDADNGDDFVVDSLGVGAGVCSILIDRGYPVIRYMGGSKSDNRELYRNRRVQSYLVCRDYFRQAKVVIDEDFVEIDEWDDVIAQLCSIRRNTNTERLEDLMTKQEMINKGIISPDRADSIAMQAATQSPELPVGDVDVIAIPGIAERYDAGLT